MQQKLKVSLNNNTMLLRDSGNLTGWGKKKKSVEFPVRLNKRAIFSFPRYAAAWCVTDSQHEAETISCNQPRTSSLHIHYIYTLYLCLREELETKGLLII